MVQPSHPSSRLWHPTERMIARIPNDPIYEHRVPMDICTMFDVHCNIPLKHFIMAGIREDGQLVSFAGPKGAAPSEVLSRYIDLEGYDKWYQTGRLMPTPSLSYEGYPEQGPDQPNTGPAYDSRRQYDRRRALGPHVFDSGTSARNRKRPRGGTHGSRDVTMNDDHAVQVVASKKGIKIGNHQDVWDFCDQRFKNIQQTACKSIAKAWVKLIAPKKQSNHPYTGKEEKAPDWWPKPWGPSKEERVRHKEPDHLYKHERVNLLNHMLHMITDPNHKQHQDIQKHGLNVNKLEEAAYEALGAFFGDAENPNNSKKKPFLKEIFKVAHYEERYKNKEIDGDYEVMVMADDKVPDSYQSDDEDDDALKEDDDPEEVSTPMNNTNPKSADHGLLVASSEPSPAGNLHGGPFLGDLPVRGQQYHNQTSLLPSDLGSGQPGFVEGNALGSQPAIPQAAGIHLQENFPDTHSTSRRPSLYGSPSEYGTSTPSGLYPSWHTTNPPATPSLYSSFEPHQPQTHQAASYVHQQPIPIPQTSQYVEAAPFDNMQRGSYEAGATNIYRTASVPQTQGFPSYLPQQHDPRGLGPNVKIEPLGRGQIQEEGGHGFGYVGTKMGLKRWNA